MEPRADLEQRSNPSLDFGGFFRNGNGARKDWAKPSTRGSMGSLGSVLMRWMRLAAAVESPREHSNSVRLDVTKSKELDLASHQMRVISWRARAITWREGLEA